MGRDEQIEEREVLESIFPDEIHNISETEYRISVLLDVTNENGDDFEPPTFQLHVRYPEEYPETPPDLDLLPTPNAPAYPFLSLAIDKQVLLDELAETIEDNLGMPMVFTLVSTLKDNAEQLIASRQSEVEVQREQKVLAAEREENKKFHGTPVTPETFVEWREGFRKEIKELKVQKEEADEAAEKKKNRGKETVIQLTGKQLWERGMAGKIEEDYEDGDEILADGVEKLAVAA